MFTGKHIRKVMYSIIGIIAIFLQSSCGLVDALSNPPLLWKTSLVENHNIVEGKMPHVVYKDGVICLGQNGENSSVYMLDKNTGKSLWRWTDMYYDSKDYLSFESVYIQNSIMIMKNGGVTYSVDLNTGKTVWKDKTISLSGGYSGLGATGLGNLYFFPGAKNSFYNGQIALSSERIYLSATANNSAELVYPSLASAFVTTNQDTSVVNPFTSSNPNTYKGLSQYTLYNLTKARSVYTTPIDSSTEGIYGVPIIFQEKVFFAVGASIACHDITTGKQVWIRKFPSSFLFAGVVLCDNKLIANCENEIMYALDPITGNIIWQTPSSGTSEAPFSMNGVLYLAGGGDGMFHAIDAANGKEIWKIPCPEANRNIFFYGHVTGADGKVFVSSYTTMYCYKAAR